jgi:hypothetical protein
MQERDLSLEIPELPGQWVVSLEADFPGRGGDARLPAGWRMQSIGSCALAHDERLRVGRLKDRTGLHVGWILGHALDAEAGLVEDWVIGAGHEAGVMSAGDMDAGKWSESLLRSLGALSDVWAGRFLIIGVERASEDVWLVPDAGCSLSMVYRTDRAVAGATPTAVNLDRLEAFVEQCQSEPELGANKFFPAGLTRTEETRRLLPNFVLELSTSRADRRWPTKPFVSGSVDRVCDVVLDRVATTIRAASRSYRLNAGLTGGRDSRMVLAAAGRAKLAGSIKWFTYAYPSNEKPEDLPLSIEIAKKLRLDHRVIEPISPTRVDRDAYLLRVGFCNNSGKAGDHDLSFRQFFDASEAMMIGYGGETAKAPYWHDRIPTEMPDAKRILELMGLPTSGRELRAMEEWLATVPAWMRPPDVLNLAYYENRMGAWALPQMYGAGPMAMFFCPMLHRDVVSANFTLPDEARRTRALPVRMGQRIFPRIGKLGFKLSGPRKSLFRRAIDKIERLVRGRAAG